MLAAMDSCFARFRPHQYGIAKKLAQVPTEDRNIIIIIRNNKDECLLDVASMMNIE